ncbi:MAG: helix-hairpin-helix domain-containing protein [Candidatus Omnitrophica bacterium]|nr:helix-hairpin-helix domain-containing protein [Candidatus Omnitrophota bacterium]
MLNLTKEEKLITIFIILALILGMGVLHFKKSIKSPDVIVNQQNFRQGAGLIEEEVKKSKQVNINSADVDELSSLPGVGKVIAARIVAYRLERGDFIREEDIKKVKGIGRKKFEKMKEYILLK